MKTQSSRRKLPHPIWVASVATLQLLFPTSLFAQTTVNLIAYWDFNNTNVVDQTVAKVGGFVGVLTNGAAYSADQGGHTGKTNDFAVDFGTNAATRSVRITDASLLTQLNTAAAADHLTVSFWLRWNQAPVNNSAVWFISPSSSSGTRGLQTHMPYGNGTIYFDTGGTTANTQRLQVGQPTGINWQLWHHIALVKDSTNKEIWLDGTRLAQGTTANPLVTDFTEIVLGLDMSNTNNQFRGTIDDFAVFGSALEQGLIGALVNGVAPDDLQQLAGDADGDGMPGWYEQLHGFDPNDPSDGPQDTDSDGLTNVQEYQKGTDPRNADTDGDSLMDGVETGTGTWVSATDTGTNPLIADTDGDGLKDGVEDNTGIFGDATHTGTNPHLADTDGDKFPDGAEVSLGSSPLDQNSVPNLGSGVVKLIAYWDFNDVSVATQTVDKVHGIAGSLLNGAVYTANQGGRTGQAGDEGINFGTAGVAGRTVRVSGGTGTNNISAWLSSAAVGDQITVSFWQKWNVAAANSSAFWMVSPSSSGVSRGFQAHCPYGNGNMYFDTAGCCTADTQRLQAAAPSGFNFQDWHHFAYVKNGSTKQIWIDGTLFLEGSGASPLPTDMTELYLGMDYSAQANTARIVMDDFAVFASALNADRINALSYGVSPIDLESATGDSDSDGLPDWWEDHYGLNKASSADAALDGDNDGLTNLQEYTIKTDPTIADTDGDGANDGAEFNTGTNPLKPDTDGDGLKDGVEDNTGIFVDATHTGTNPFFPDSDGDLYSDGAEVILGSSPVSASSIPITPGGTNLLAYWDFNNSSVATQTVDRIHSFVGELLNGAAFTSDQLGRSGQPGDRAVDFGSTAVAGRGVHVTGAQWLDAGGVPDAMTVSFWQKWNTNIANSSAFWFVSPLSANGQRGAHAETPWGDGNIPWDTGGTAVPSQRIIANITTFTNLAANSFFTNWHHFAFVKNGTSKEVWLDGRLFNSTNTAAVNFLPIDFTEIYLGVEPGGANNMRARMDDFAVYASALTPTQIGLLAQGASPIDFKIPELPPSITSASVSSGSITILWTGGGTLQSSPVLGPSASWNTAGTGGVFSEPASGTKFYRVSR